MTGYGRGPEFSRGNRDAHMYSGLRVDPIQVVFVDFSGGIAPQRKDIDPSLSYYEFLSELTELTAPVAWRLPGLACFKFPGQGLTLADGNWLYRVIKPFSYSFIPGIHSDTDFPEYPSSHTPTFGEAQSDTSTRIFRSGTDANEWSILSTATAYQRMIDRMTYGYSLKGAWIEIQHQLQKDRDDRSWAMAEISGDLDNPYIQHPTSPDVTETSSRSQMAYPFNPYTHNRSPTSEFDQGMGWGAEPPADDMAFTLSGGQSTLVSTAPRAYSAALAHSVFGSVDPQIISNANWQPPRPGMLLAPRTSRSAAPAVPPDTNSLPTTIDPAVLRRRSAGAAVRVRLPRQTTWEWRGSRLVGRDGSEIVFGASQSGEVTRDDHDHRPYRARGTGRGVRSRGVRGGRWGRGRGGSRGAGGSPLSSDITSALTGAGGSDDN